MFYCAINDNHVNGEYALSNSSNGKKVEIESKVIS